MKNNNKGASTGWCNLLQEVQFHRAPPVCLVFRSFFFFNDTSIRKTRPKQEKNSKKKRLKNRKERSEKRREEIRRAEVFVCLSFPEECVYLSVVCRYSAYIYLTLCQSLFILTLLWSPFPYLSATQFPTPPSFLTAHNFYFGLSQLCSSSSN